MRMLNNPKATVKSALLSAAIVSCFDNSLVDFFLRTYSPVQQVLDDALRGQETSNYELTFLTKSKEIRYLLVNATTRRDAEGNVVGVVGGQFHFGARKEAHCFRFSIIFILPINRLFFGTNLTVSYIYCLKTVAQDVTETKKNEIAVSAMANELRQLVDTANAPIFGIDVDGRVNEWNNKTIEVTGFSREEAWNKPLVSDFIEPAFKESVQQVLDDALRGMKTSNYELTFLTKSKEIRYLLVNATTRRDAAGNIVGVVGGQYRFVLANKRTLFFPVTNLTFSYIAL
jgi:PAS domain S-box-containing protein